MMKFQKRLVSVTVLTALLCATLAGCAAGQGGSGTASSDTTQSDADNGQNGNGTTQSDTAPQQDAQTGDGAISYEGMDAVLAFYPNAGAYDDYDTETFSMSDAYSDWWQSYFPLLEQSMELQDGMDAYYAHVIERLLITDAEETENAVCSPVNIYIALAMLAETTDGNTRQQILDALGADSIDALRARTKALWEANYVDTPVLTSLLANSVWMRRGASYREETLKTLAERYYASSFSGEMGSDELNRALQDWTNDNTGGELEDAVKDLKTDPETVLALISTIYYKAAWMEEFPEVLTDKGIFHGVSGDTEADMMHRSDQMAYYTGENFTGIGCSLTDSGAMYFFLPDEGTDVAEIVNNPQTLAIARGTQDGINVPYLTVNITMPKFRIEAQTDLMDAFRAMGMTDMMDAGIADFSPLTDELDGMSVSSAQHAAMVEIDEDGVTGAAYTVIMVTEGAYMDDGEEVDFICDRPFYFIVTGRDNSVLFTGVVRHVD